MILASAQRHILISFMGTGNYSEVKYVFPNGASYSSTNCTVAASKILKPDKTIVFMTSKANEEKGQQLCKDISFQFVEIPELQSENDIWTLFEKVLEVIEESDLVSLDVTHGFRTQPLVSAMSLIYARRLKNISISGIYYGAFETRDELNNVNVYDISNLLYIVDWSLALSNFIEFGSFKSVSVLLSDIQRFCHTQNLETKPVKADRAGKDLSYISEAIGISDIRKTFEHSNSLLKNSEALRAETKAIGSFKPLSKFIDNIENEIRKSSCNSTDFSSEQSLLSQMNIVEWCFKTSRYQQGITILRELLISFACNIQKVNSDDLKMREDIGYVLSSHIKKDDRKEYKSVNANYDLIRSFLDNNKDAVKVWDQTIQFRNGMNHAFMGKQPLKLTTLNLDLNTLLNLVRQVVTDYFRHQSNVKDAI